MRVAPLVGVPMQRRRQTFAVFSFLIQPLSAPVTFLGVIILAHRAGYGLYVGSARRELHRVDLVRRFGAVEDAADAAVAAPLDLFRGRATSSPPSW